MATLSSILAGRIPWAEEAGGLQSMGSQRVGHDRAHTHMQVTVTEWQVPWSRAAYLSPLHDVQPPTHR